MRKHNYLNLFLITVLSSIFCIVLSCSDESNYHEEDDNPSPTPTNVSPASPSFPSYSLLSSPDKCLVGWDIHPYKECSKESFGIKSYKEARSAECGIEIKNRICKRCRNPKFGIEKTEVVFSKEIEANKEQNLYKNTRFDNTFCQSEMNKTKGDLQKRFGTNDFIINVTLISSFFDKQNLPIGMKGDPSSSVNLKFFCKYQAKVEKIIQYFEQESCDVCGVYEENIYKSCRHPSHGVEEYNSKVSKECGTNEDITVRSKNTLSIDEVKNLEGEVLGCKMCNDINFDPSNMDDTNKNVLINKISCLLDNLDQLDSQDSARFFIISELKQLYSFSELINKTNPDLFNRMKEHI